MNRRVFLIVMDSVGIGGAPDAGDFANDGVPDTGANTLGHIIESCAKGEADIGRRGPLSVPTLAQLGLYRALELASGLHIPNDRQVEPSGKWGAAIEISKGKDTPSGHWELAGVPVPWDWGYFPNAVPSFPSRVTEAIMKSADVDGLLGNCHASGTEIIEKFGIEHITSGKPICYTSVDSVLQIAAHEELFGLERLYNVCMDCASVVHPMRIGRVIARPFVGNGRDVPFRRTPNRKDFAIEPPSPTICDWVHSAGRKVYAIGKIGDIFSMRGISEVRKGADSQLADHLTDLVHEAEDGSLVFANFVEFDSEYGHRRDISGYARHLEWFDRVLQKVIKSMRPDDLLIVTADHGNDPSWIGTDHTREQVPVLVFGAGKGPIGARAFVDVAASAADFLDIPYEGEGRSFL